MDEYIERHVEHLDDLMAWLDDRIDGLDPKEAVLIARQLVARAKRLSDYAAMIERTAANKLHDAGIKQATIRDGDRTLSVKLVNRSRRTNLRRDDLMRDVERLAADPALRVDTATGELDTIESTRTRLLKRVFRFEPRWAEVEKLGMTADEYCEVAWTRSIEVDEVEEL